MPNYMFSVDYQWLFLPEPDIGMPEQDAQRFFHQLMAGVVGTIASYTVLKINTSHR